VTAFDNGLLALLADWQVRLQTPVPGRSRPSPKKGRTQRAPKRTSDLKVARQPNNAYPVYMTLKKAAAFPMDRLRGNLDLLAAADRRLKTGSRDPQLALAHLIDGLCER
jgi:DNA polymerase III delta subunit